MSENPLDDGSTIGKILGMAADAAGSLIKGAIRGIEKSIEKADDLVQTASAKVADAKESLSPNSTQSSQGQQLEAGIAKSKSVEAPTVGSDSTAPLTAQMTPDEPTVAPPTPMQDAIEKAKNINLGSAANSFSADMGTAPEALTASAGVNHQQFQEQALSGYSMGA